MESEFWPRTGKGDLATYLNEHEERRLMSLMEPCVARAGDVILKKGSPSKSLLVVEEGEIEVLDDSQGQPLVLGRVGPGGVVGEVGFIDGKARTHHVRAIVDCRLRRLTREALLRLVKGDPDLFAKLTIAVAQLLARRYRAAMDELGPVRAFAASLREPMAVEASLGGPEEFSEIDAPLPGAQKADRSAPGAGPEAEAHQALGLIRDVARRALEGHGPAGV